jgi:Fe-S cluster biogenesis protein NfuA
MLSKYKNQIELALDTIRPYLEADGGNVQISWTFRMRWFYRLNF